MWGLWFGVIVLGVGATWWARRQSGGSRVGTSFRWRKGQGRDPVSSPQPPAVERLGYLALAPRRAVWVVRIGTQVWGLAGHEQGLTPFGPIPWESSEASE